jgi:hypothetical protein
MNFIGFSDVMATVRIYSRIRGLDAKMRWASAAVTITPQIRESCCPNEKRDMNGSCINCGDPCI